MDMEKIKMGLFKEKFCYKCGEKIGFLSGKSGDDFHICGNCLKKYSADSSSRKGKLKDISNKEEFDRYLEFCEKNREELGVFQKTKSFFKFIQIDGYAEKIIFVNDFDFERKDKLKVINPPVYDLNNLLFYHVINKDVSDKKGIINKYIRLKQNMIFGFENEWFPVACDYTVDVDMPVKEGIFKDKVLMSSEWEDMISYLLEYTSKDFMQMMLNFLDNAYEIAGSFTEIENKYFEQLQIIRRMQTMSSTEMSEYLKGTIANKVTRKKVAREYDL